MKKFLTLILILIFAVSAFFLLKPSNKEEISNPYANSEITYEIFETEDGFGYEVSIDGQAYVRQSNIPAVTGNKGFENREDASLVAEIMMQKIKEGILPPTVTLEELDGLGVNY